MDKSTLNIRKRVCKEDILSGSLGNSLSEGCQFLINWDKSSSKYFIIDICVSISSDESDNTEKCTEIEVVPLLEKQIKRASNPDEFSKSGKISKKNLLNVEPDGELVRNNTNESTSTKSKNILGFIKVEPDVEEVQSDKVEEISTKTNNTVLNTVFEKSQPVLETIEIDDKESRSVNKNTEKELYDLNQTVKEEKSVRLELDRSEPFNKKPFERSKSLRKEHDSAQVNRNKRICKSRYSSYHHQNYNEWHMDHYEYGFNNRNCHTGNRGNSNRKMQKHKRF